MKIDIGNGKILGTKRVSANGQVSGFTEFAGREVLVVLPEGEPQVRLDTKEYVRELQVAANEYMKVAFEKYRDDLKPKFRTPEAATRDFIQKYAPQKFHGLFDQMDTWVKDQVDRAEGRVEEVLERGGRRDAPESEKPAIEEAASTTEGESEGKSGKNSHRKAESTPNA